jgi:hypothetical protein
MLHPKCYADKGKLFKRGPFIPIVKNTPLIVIFPTCKKQLAGLLLYGKTIKEMRKTLCCENANKAWCVPYLTANVIKLCGIFFHPLSGSPEREGRPAKRGRGE